MMNAQVAPDAAQVHSIHIQLYRLLTHLLWIASRLGLGCVLASTVHAHIPLRSRFGLTNFILTFGLLTFWTCLHYTILIQNFIHSLLKWFITIVR
jgi:hypothetical protein